MEFKLHYLARLSFGFLVFLVSGFVQAAERPDAGQLLQQIEKERSVKLPKKSAPEIDSTPQPSTPISNAAITVTSFQFEGNTLFDNDRLTMVVGDYLDRPLAFSDLREAAATVAAHYRQSGWVVRTSLPSQDVTEGVVIIKIVEAVFGGAQIEGDPQRFTRNGMLARVEAVQPKGARLNVDKLDRALVLIDDLPGIIVSGSLVKGQGDAETDLLIKAYDEAMFSGSVSADNAASRATGRERFAANLYLNSPLRFGDLLSTNLMHSEGSDYVRLAYSIPIGANGWRIGANGSYLDYDLVASDFKGLDAKGTSSTFGLEASYPIIRSRVKNLFLGLNIARRHFDNEALQTTTTNYEVNNLSATLNGHLFDDLWGGGANSADLTLTRGDVDLDGSPNQAADRLTARTDGTFTKLNYSFSRQQFLTDRFSATIALAGQVADKNLDSSEKFYLGGAYGVRAYPANEGGGADGQLLNLELRAQLPRNFIFTGFYDLGHVRVNKNNATLQDPNNSITLKGVGLSVSWLADFGLSLKATWAHRIGSNPNPATNGKDQDGSLVKNRFWLQAGMPF